MRTKEKNRQRQVASYLSKNGNRYYHVMLDLDSGRLTCDCPAWIYNVHGNRTCPHTRRVQREVDLDQIVLGRLF